MQTTLPQQFTNANGVISNKGLIISNSNVRTPNVVAYLYDCTVISNMDIELRSKR